MSHTACRPSWRHFKTTGAPDPSPVPGRPGIVFAFVASAAHPRTFVPAFTKTKAFSPSDTAKALTEKSVVLLVKVNMPAEASPGSVIIPSTTKSGTVDGAACTRATPPHTATSKRLPSPMSTLYIVCSLHAMPPVSYELWRIVCLTAYKGKAFLTPLMYLELPLTQAAFCCRRLWSWRVRPPSDADAPAQPWANAL